MLANVAVGDALNLAVAPLSIFFKLQRYNQGDTHTPGCEKAVCCTAGGVTPTVSSIRESRG